jgi:hypothetical protein
MIGYTLKYHGRDGFANPLHNVSPQEGAAGKLAFLQFGAALKNRVELKLSNTFERARTYYEFAKFALGKRMRISLAVTLFSMVRSGNTGKYYKYVVGAEWVVPRLNWLSYEFLNILLFHLVVWGLGLVSHVGRAVIIQEMLPPLHWEGLVTCNQCNEYIRLGGARPNNDQHDGCASKHKHTR